MSLFGGAAGGGFGSGAGGGLFGGGGGGAQSSSGGFGFGQPGAPQSGGGGLFQPSTGGFGAQNRPSTGGGGLFGGGATNTFGSSTTTPSGGGGGGLFGGIGQTGGGGGFFGNQQQSGGGGLFGGQTTGNSLFGQQTTQTSAFGQLADSTFGSSSSPFGTQPQGQTSGFGRDGLFGQNQPAGGGLFASQQQQQQPSGSLFGQGSSSSGGGLFGSSSAFGQQCSGPTFSPQPDNDAGGKICNIVAMPSVKQEQCQEELRWEYYQKNAQTGQPAGSMQSASQPFTTPTSSLFGSSSTTPTAGGLFGSGTSTGGGFLGGPGGVKPGGLFGSQTTQPSTGGGGLFGGGATNTFGSSTTTPSGGLFGGIGQTGGGGGLFGNQQQSGGGGLFGGQTTGNSLFGQQTTQTSAFGQPATTNFGQASGGGGLFGSSASQTSGGLFGAGTPQGSSLFGGQQQQQTSGSSLFGGTQVSTQSGLLGTTPTTGGMAFGQQGATGGSLFGGTATGGSLFGGQQQQTSSLFGGQQTGASSGSSSLFGGGNSVSSAGGLFSTTSGSLFGATAQAKPPGSTPSLFGATTTPPGGGLFGGGSSGSGGGSLFGGLNTATTGGLGAAAGGVSGGFGANVMGTDPGYASLFGTTQLTLAALAMPPSYYGEGGPSPSCPVLYRPEPEPLSRGRRYRPAGAVPMRRESSGMGCSLSLPPAAVNSLLQPPRLTSHIIHPGGTSNNLSSARRSLNGVSVGSQSSSQPRFGPHANGPHREENEILAPPGSLNPAVEEDFSAFNFAAMDRATYNGREEKSGSPGPRGYGSSSERVAIGRRSSTLESPETCSHRLSTRGSASLPPLEVVSTMTSDGPSCSVTPRTLAGSSVCFAGNRAEFARGPSISPPHISPRRVRAAALALLPILTKDGYSTHPSMQTLKTYDEARLAEVEDFKVIQEAHGEIMWPGLTDVRGLDLDSIVSISRLEVCVYPNEVDSPPVNEGLNKQAVITLKNCKPRKLQIPTDEVEFNEMFAKQKYKTELYTKRMGAKFLSLDPITWEWKFQVDHFSKYGMPSAFDESEDNDGTTATVSGDFLPGEEKIGDENAAFEVNVSFAHPHPSQQIHRRPSPATVASPSFSSFPLSSPGASSSRTLYPHSSLPTAPPKRHSVVSLSSAAPSPKLRRAPPELSSFSAPFSFSASATSFASPPAVTIDESVPSFAPLTTSFPPPIPSPLIVPLGTSSTLPPYAKPLSASAVRNESRILGFPSHGPVDSFQSSRFCACLSLAANGLLVLPHAGGGVRGGGRTMITGISGGGPIGIVDPEFKTDAEGRGKGGGTETRTWLSLVKVTSLIAPTPQLENWDSGSLPMPLSRDEDEGVGKALEEYLQESRDGYVEDLSQRRDGGTNILTSKNRHNRRGRQPPPAVIRQFGGGGPLTILPVPKAVDGTTIFVSRTVPCDVVHRVVKGFEDRLKEWKGLNVKPSVDAINGLIRYQRKLARENLAIFCGDVSPLIASDLKKRNQHLETYYLARYADETWALLSALFERRLSEGCFLSDGTEKCSGIPSDLQWLKGRRRGERGGGAEEDNGEDEEETEEEGRGSRAARVLRDVYLRLSGWLQSLNGRTIRAFLELPANPKCLKEGDEEEERMKVVFHLLSGLLVPEAVECLVGLQELFRGGGQSPIPGAYVFLASLITMTGSQTFQRIVIRQQLDHFDAVGFLNKIPLGVRRLYQLLSGYLSDLPSKESLDWKTTFALHWWFPDPVRDLQLEATPPPQALDGPRDLVRAMVQYERSFLRPGQSSVLPPLASYLRGVRGNPQEMGEGSIEEGELSLSNKLDLQFSLLKIFAGREELNLKFFDLHSHTPFRLDASLAWPVACVLLLAKRAGYFGKAGGGRAEEEAKEKECGVGEEVIEVQMSRLHALFAAQLEGMGLWHWACFVLMQMPDKVSARSSIRELLIRNAWNFDASDEQQVKAANHKRSILVRVLGVHEAWWYEAGAVYQEYRFHYWEAAQLWEAAYYRSVSLSSSAAAASTRGGTLEGESFCGEQRKGEEELETRRDNWFHVMLGDVQWSDSLGSTYYLEKLCENLLRVFPYFLFDILQSTSGVATERLLLDTTTAECEGEMERFEEGVDINVTRGGRGKGQLSRQVEMTMTGDPQLVKRLECLRSLAERLMQIVGVCEDNLSFSWRNSVVGPIYFQCLQWLVKTFMKLPWEEGELTEEEGGEDEASDFGGERRGRRFDLSGDIDVEVLLGSVEERLRESEEGEGKVEEEKERKWRGDEEAKWLFLGVWKSADELKVERMFWKAMKRSLNLHLVMVA